MKKHFEPIGSKKFLPLSNSQQNKVLGGRGTGSGKEESGQFQERYIPNPEAPGQTILQYRAIYKTWGSDEILDDGTTCRYSMGIGYGEWR